MHTLENLLQALDPLSASLQCNEGQVDHGKRTLPFFYRNVVYCLRYLVRQIAYRDVPCIHILVTVYTSGVQHFLCLV